MPTIVNSLRNVLDADANATAINANAFLYSTQAEALNASEQLFIISEYVTRQRQLFLGNGYTEEESGNIATGSMQDFGGNYPDPFDNFFSSGVQVGFTTPPFPGAPTPFPLSSYGEQGGLVDNVGLRHYHHQIQFGLHLDGTTTYTGWFAGTVTVDYMVDNFGSNGTILGAGGGNGTWDQTNISLGDLRGIQKPITTVAGTSGLGVSIENVLLGDPLNQAPQGFGAGELTGFFTEDGVDKQLCQSTSQEVSVGGHSDGI